MNQVNDGDVAMLRGVRNCGEHHEENRLAPALQFAQECDRCAGSVFVAIYNAGVQTMEINMNNQIQALRRAGHRI